MTAYLRAAGFSYNEFGLVGNMFVLVSGGIIGLVEKKFGGCASEFVFWLPN